MAVSHAIIIDANFILKNRIWIGADCLFIIITCLSYLYILYRILNYVDEKSVLSKHQNIILFP